MLHRIAIPPASYMIERIVLIDWRSRLQGKDLIIVVEEGDVQLLIQPIQLQRIYHLYKQQR